MNTIKSFCLLRALAGASRDEVATACFCSTATVHDAENRTRSLNTNNGTFTHLFIEFVGVSLHDFIGLSLEVEDCASEKAFWEEKDRAFRSLIKVFPKKRLLLQDCVTLCRFWQKDSVESNYFTKCSIEKLITKIEKHQIKVEWIK